MCTSTAVTALPSLLILDNFEHLLDRSASEADGGTDSHASSFVAAILQRAPGVTILATARERLNLHGEWVVAVEGLPYPEAEDEEPALSAEKGRRMMVAYRSSFA